MNNKHFVSTKPSYKDWTTGCKPHYAINFTADLGVVQYNIFIGYTKDIVDNVKDIEGVSEDDALKSFLACSRNLAYLLDHRDEPDSEKRFDETLRELPLVLLYLLRFDEYRKNLMDIGNIVSKLSMTERLDENKRYQYAFDVVGTDGKMSAVLVRKGIKKAYCELKDTDIDLAVFLQ